MMGVSPVEAQNYLGIYISRDNATVVCIGPQGHEHRILGCFSVTADAQEGLTAQLARLIADECAERIPNYRDCEVGVALDCAMFMQHSVRSEFTDPKQIAATVRFDTEEALSTNISDVALAFETASTNQNGSQLTIFTARQDVLSDILLSLQSHNIDPVTIEPDVHCLARFVEQKVSFSDDSGCLFSLLSAHKGYFIAFSKTRQTPAVRTFLVAGRQNRSDLLAREITVTSALAGGPQPLRRARIFDSQGSVDCGQLAERLGMEVQGFDPAAAAGAETDLPLDHADRVGFAAAYGAALAHLEKTQTINFRNDFMPYQGKKMRLQKMAKLLSIALTILVFAIGIYFHAELFRTGKARRALRNKLKPDYLMVMPGKERLPSNYVKILGGEIRRIENVKKGLVEGAMSIPAKLTLILKAFNSCAKETDLNINLIVLTDRNVNIAGDTRSKGNRNTLAFFQAIRDTGLIVSQPRMDSKGGRDNFRVTVLTKAENKEG